ncbi:hypothetical protein Verru16b_01783 [Lacunisphaera limnophila]|uniref:Uncharacterized protein n=1 Tax=Lacunisphaera limnophila TaxID=1838286 RepID=A0A1D8AV50_9BACT|nr:hypothetical protein [Lacunisphaera limnophila]AOS44716.1 hypothetical protein Verru16b_01783 [Lacunisphaera limnophila]
MKPKDYLLIALVPLALLLIPLTGQLTVDGWNWTWHDFVFAWVVFATTTFFYRLLATRRVANLAYKAAAALAVLTGFLVFWISAAVQIIGDENPANVLYLAVILTGLIGTGVARFQPAGMARAAFATAGVTFLIPVVALLFWPADFSPGVAKVFLLNGGFVLLFTASGLLFRHAAGQAGSNHAMTTPAQS